MGGFGSGRWHRWNKSATVDGAKKIDIRYMRKEGLLKPGCRGSLSWSRKGKSLGAISFYCREDYLQLNYNFQENDGEWKPIEQRIRFDRTPCNYGGERLWFLCSGCNRRVAVLCSNGAYFFCRHCGNLSYSSRQLSSTDRIIARKHELGTKIFETYESGRGFGKKKGMHWKTFNKHYVKYRSLEQQWCLNITRLFTES